LLASKIRQRIDVPHEKGEWFEFRALGGRKLEEARNQRSLTQFAALRAMGTDVLAALKGATTDEPAEAPEPDLLTAFDVDTILRAGITAWSYGPKVRPEDIDDLDEQTRKWAAREILALCGETEAERGNG
jgi:hypothetical protein